VSFPRSTNIIAAHVVMVLVTNRIGKMHPPSSRCLLAVALPAAFEIYRLAVLLDQKMRR